MAEAAESKEYTFENKEFRKTYGTKPLTFVKPD